MLKNQLLVKFHKKLKRINKFILSNKTYINYIYDNNSDT